ncbi:hypothetical protein SAMN04487895_101659 [Paenibacillus sophorae]|uniref:Plasmid maintenance system antidote protein, XRE family n=1 Tax=Paenibacillus sophorae TaxID=1333845 RepID=A0A1H8GVU5_9BACL|nr:hypothetical protein [Paenibacillus sophorae]QWU14356.1 plasmid maintenance system antidote protein, XRE family [Paenibacillus sophorae]SEN47985.1 hypothetical protein SAMN04487895_101659 [Paenibacillus sophorae]
MNEYQAPIAVPPCETFKEVLEDREWTKEKFIKETGVSEEYYDALNTSKIRYDDEKVSSLLQQVFQIPKSFWTNLEHNYQETLLRLNS